jgi:hypothetical protein
MWPFQRRVGTAASGPKVVSGSGADKPADESGLEAWRNKELLLLLRHQARKGDSHREGFLQTAVQEEESCRCCMHVVLGWIYTKRR